MLVAITGTPGSGKTSASMELAHRGHDLMSVNDLIEMAMKEGGLEAITDPVSGSLEVEVEELSRLSLPHLPEHGFVEGHLSHFLPVDVVAVLRISPSLVEERLESRGYPESKVRENMEAEAIGVILSEAMELPKEDARPDDSGIRLQKVYEIDVTSLKVETVADILENILLGRSKPGEHVPGRVDWSEEILSWY